MTAPRRPNPVPTEELASLTRKAASPEFNSQMGAMLEELAARYGALPEFIREDLMEGILVGGLGIGLPVAMMPNQDPHEAAAAILGGMTAATLGGAAARSIGARIGARLHPGELAQGGYRYNLGRLMGQKDLLDTVRDMAGTIPVPKITGAEFGRALGRGIGDEVSGIGGTLGAVALAQAMDKTPDEPAGPSLGQIAMGTIPGAVIGMATSGLIGGAYDGVAAGRMVYGNEEFDGEKLMQSSPFLRRGGKK